MKRTFPLCAAALAALSSAVPAQNPPTTALVDTGQNRCYDANREIPLPAAGQPFAGQDAANAGQPAAYQVHGDGTVSDLVTGLMWQQTPDLDNKASFAQAVAGAATFALAGHRDWRLPTIKELYSLIDFRGSSSSLVPYIDTDVFAFRFGDPSRGERIIDAQYWSSTEYVGTTMNGDATVFGVNFADGRIKGYPRDRGPSGVPTQFVRYVRGPSGYGDNRFVDQGDGTVADQASGLVWAKADSATAMDWQAALAWAENLTLGGHDDWRLPNAKELQSIVDYTRAPDATDPSRRAPAIDPVFTLTTDESWCWASTTHLDGPQPNQAVYVCFGQAFGYMGPPGSGQWLNVHGAGAQRSDPKSGDPTQYPYGRGPQGDEIRILNYVRAVRGGVGTSLAAGRHALVTGSVADVTFHLSGGNGLAGRDYLLLASLSGTRPTTTLRAGAELPLALDSFSTAVLALANTPALADFVGTLDGAGEATASLHSGAPLPPALVGLSLSFAWLTVPDLDFASNATVVDIEG